MRRLTDQHAHTEHVAALQAGHDLRERQPPALHTRDEQERTAALQPAAVAPQTNKVGIGGRDVTSPDLRVLDPGHLAVMAPMPHEIDSEARDR